MVGKSTTNIWTSKQKDECGTMMRRCGTKVGWDVFLADLCCHMSRSFDFVTKLRLRYEQRAAAANVTTSSTFNYITRHYGADGIIYYLC